MTMQFDNKYYTQHFFATLILQSKNLPLIQDILFGLIKRLFIAKSSKTSTRKHPLKIIVMSASLNQEKFSNFFGSCPVLEIPGRTFPVKNVYCNHIGKDNINTPNYLTKVSRILG